MNPHDQPNSAPHKFSYDGMDPESATRLQALTNDIRKLTRTTSEIIFEIGERLGTAKGIVRHGEWGSYLEREFGWTERTAQRFMNVHETFRDKSDIVSVLGPTALYLLAAPSVPQTVRDSVEVRLQQGERLSIREVKQLIDAEGRTHQPGTRFNPPSDAAPQSQAEDQLGAEERPGADDQPGAGERPGADDPPGAGERPGAGFDTKGVVGPEADPQSSSEPTPSAGTKRPSSKEATEKDPVLSGDGFEGRAETDEPEFLLAKYVVEHFNGEFDKLLTGLNEVDPQKFCDALRGACPKPR
ncbi:DUF3102 domain-containing protein [Methylobacterium durans]|uniref:DUF3102 domain-containing protein n=1 Tax=Methylobacterium durans TaxID=2202825 RepID=A0A2U8W1A4_9HYPH|nr:DUF3102 domain-containing protein [Methylobacterium durans]AWN39845.1 hypothetical protein DK389_03970 [Methylobacterium durans]